MAKVILIAEDNENDALAIGQTVRNAGVKNPLKIVNDGTEVVAYFTGQGQYADRTKYPLPSVLLLDLQMPRMGGFAVLQWLNNHKSGRAILAVVLTGNGDVENVRRAYSLGAKSFLAKPCSMEDIKNLVEAYPAYWETDGINEPVSVSDNE